jgi:SAM-dependent methyltransferase
MRAMSSLVARLPPPVRRLLGRYRRRLSRTSAPIVRPRPGPDSMSVGAKSPEPAQRAKSEPAQRAKSEPALPAKSRLEVRRELRRKQIFTTADPKGSILEIGPAHYGILPKRDGFNTKNVDYLDRPGLIEKYRSFPQYSADDIEDVDYVLPPGAAMADVIPDRFDLVLASHVLEHTTSVVDFLNQCTKLLCERGVISLVVPDHRYCFDRFRERSSLSRVVDASLNPPAVHTVGTLTEYFMYAAQHNGVASWAAGHPGKYRLQNTLEQVQQNAALTDTGNYVDVHNWVFAPHHLRLLLQDLYSLDLISVREAFFHDTVGHEFFLNLTVEAEGSGLSREELLVLADAERRSMDIPAFEGIAAEDVSRNDS